MKTDLSKLGRLVFVLFVFPWVLVVSAHGRESTGSFHVETETVTLYSRIKYSKEWGGGYGRSAFSFDHGVRSDRGHEVTRNNYELIYGNIDLNGDRDWFGVTMVTDDCSRIKDLGEWDWTEVAELPMLEAKNEPHSGITMPGEGRSFEQSSDGQVTRVAVGHVYLVHTKDRNTDFFTVFRVDELVPGDNVTISWKKVPLPGSSGRKP